MPLRRIQVSSQLAAALLVLEEEFDLLPGELVRLGVLNPLKLIPVGRRPVNSCSVEVLISKNLSTRLDEQAKRVECPSGTLIENILWMMVQEFLERFPAPVRDNPEGVGRFRRALDQMSWW